MLKQTDIDRLALDVQNYGIGYMYKVDNITDKFTYDAIVDGATPKYVIREIKVTGVKNAYLEYLKYTETPNRYSKRIMTFYTDPVTPIRVSYVSNRNPMFNSYTKPVNPSIAPIVYGIGAMDDQKGVTLTSKISPVYTNNIVYSTLNSIVTNNHLINGNLDWKYKTLESPVNVDGIEYNYITSDWYIITVDDEFIVEHPLVNVNEKCVYFKDIDEAYSYMQQLTD